MRDKGSGVEMFLFRGRDRHFYVNETDIMTTKVDLTRGAVSFTVLTS